MEKLIVQFLIVKSVKKKSVFMVVFLSLEVFKYYDQKFGLITSLITFYLKVNRNIPARVSTKNVFAQTNNWSNLCRSS